MRRLLLSLCCLPLLLPFAAWGQVQVDEIDGIAAVVNDDVITYSELDQRLREVVQQLRAQNTPLPEQGVLVRQVLERLLIERLQLDLAQRTGVRVGDEELNRIVGQIAAENGMDLMQFREALRRDGMEFTEFRERIREEVIITRLRQRQVDNRVQISRQEVESFLEQQAQSGADNREYRLAHLMIAVPETANTETIQAARAKAERLLGELRDGADFRQYAIAHSDGQQALDGGDLGWRTADRLPTIFAEPAVRMSPGEISEVLRTPSGFHIIQLTDVRGEQRSLVRQVRARHILIRTDEITSDTAARTRLERLRQRILSGADFAELARGNSDDPGSASRGGDLGWVSPGQMVPQFEEQMLNTPLGEISAPFRTQFGWHIVQPTEERDYDNTREALETRARQVLTERRVAEQTESWLRQLRDEAYVEIRLE